MALARRVGTKRRSARQGSWRCKDCGKLSSTYRCPSCKRKWLAKHGMKPVDPSDTYELDDFSGGMVD